jgi:hypothetical protein
MRHCSISPAFGRDLLSKDPTDKAPIPAFMQIEGRIARPLPAEATRVNTRKFWLVQPWVIVTLVIAILVALLIPGLLMDLNRGF